MSAFPRIDKTEGCETLELIRGCTFDDFILSPQRSVLLRRDPTAIDLSSSRSRRITLKRPIVSANMDTVTRAPMAIVQAEEGGIGIIDRGFRSGEIEPAGRGVEKGSRGARGPSPRRRKVEPALPIADFGRARSNRRCVKSRK